MTFRELGIVMLDMAGAKVCRDVYGTTVPEEVGVNAIAYGDMNRDGTINY
jgi:hypothetical protein